MDPPLVARRHRRVPEGAFQHLLKSLFHPLLELGLRREFPDGPGPSEHADLFRPDLQVQLQPHGRQQSVVLRISRHEGEVGVVAGVVIPVPALLPDGVPDSPDERVEGRVSFRLSQFQFSLRVSRHVPAAGPERHDLREFRLRLGLHLLAVYPDLPGVVGQPVAEFLRGVPAGVRHLRSPVPPYEVFSLPGLHPELQGAAVVGQRPQHFHVHCSSLSSVSATVR